VVERHPDWKAEPRRRSLAGGVYLLFLIPGLMSTCAQVDAGNPLIWRTSFGLAAVLGGITTVRLVSIDRNRRPRPRLRTSDGPRGRGDRGDSGFPPPSVF
jgi:hypothetical protein